VPLIEQEYFIVDPEDEDVLEAPEVPELPPDVPLEPLEPPDDELVLDDELHATRPITNAPTRIVFRMGRTIAAQLGGGKNQSV
jgi:hypothetical protein